MVQGEFITTADVARLLKISTSTVQKMAREGRLPALKVGKLWRFPSQSPHILLYKQEQQAARRAARLALKETAKGPRSGLREFVKLAANIGFIEPPARGAWGKRV